MNELDNGVPDQFLHPIADDLLAVIGLLMVEGDELRLHTNRAVVGQRRTFTDDDLKRGRSVGAFAMMPDANHLVIRLES